MDSGDPVEPPNWNDYAHANYSLVTKYDKRACFKSRKVFITMIVIAAVLGIIAAISAMGYGIYCKYVNILSN